MPIEELLNIEEAATLAGLAQSTLRLQARRGRMKARKFGRDWAITRGSLHDYLKSVGRKPVKRLRVARKLPEHAAKQHKPATSESAA